MKKNYAFILLVIFANACPLIAQVQWQNYTSGTFITALDLHKNNLWIATRGGGLVKIDTQTEDTTIYKKINSGIKNDVLSAVVEDTAGTVFIGMYEKGLAKFDGTSWTTLQQNTGAVYRLAVDSSNVVWMTADSGVYKIKNSVVTKITDLPKDHYYGVGFDHQGNQWFGSEANGVIKYNNGIIKIYNDTLVPFLHFNFCADIKFDKQNNLWAASPGGLIKFDGSNWTIWNIQNSNISDNNITSVQIDEQQNIWLSTKGVSKFNGTSFTNYNEQTTNYPGTVEYANGIVLNKKDKWIGTSNFGLFKLTDTAFVRYPTSDCGLETSEGTLMGQDKNGKLWFGSNSARYGIASFDGTTWTNYLAPGSDYLINHSFSLAFDSLGNTWSATLMGLFKFDGTKWTLFSTTASLYSIGFDKSGKLFAISSDGLLRFDGTKFIKIGGDPGSKLVFDKKGNIWMVGYVNGIIKYDGSTFTSYNSSNSPFQSNYFFTIGVDRNDQVWAGGQGATLVKFDGSNWTVYDTTNCPIPPTAYITDITGDDQGVWIAASEAGLFQLNGTTWTNYNESNSPISSRVYAISYDQEGNKWLSQSLAGFLRMKIDKITTVPTSEKSEKLITVYPNPAQDVAFVSFKPEPNKKYTFYLADISGKTVAAIDNITTTNFKINLEKLAKGAYLYTFVTGNELVGTGKFIVR